MTVTRTQTADDKYLRQARDILAGKIQAPALGEGANIRNSHNAKEQFPLGWVLLWLAILILGLCAAGLPTMIGALLHGGIGYQRAYWCVVAGIVVYQTLLSNRPFYGLVTVILAVGGWTIGHFS